MVESKLLRIIALLNDSKIIFMTKIEYEVLYSEIITTKNGFFEKIILKIQLLLKQSL